MQGGLLNIAILSGLAGVAIPVLIHLISRRRYQIEPWGAMRFLVVSETTRRRLRLEELLLLAVRMLLIAALVIAMARPWFISNLLGLFRSKANRDVVLLIDQSASMAFTGGAITPQVAAQDAAGALVRRLLPGDGIGLLAVRDQPEPLIDRLVHEPAVALEALSRAAVPSGSADFAAAVVEALRLLGKASYLQREIVIFTDGQRYGWHADDATRWQLVAGLIRSASGGPEAARPRVWVQRVGPAAEPSGPGRAPADAMPNWTLDPLVADRPVVARGLPVTLSTAVAALGQPGASRRQVFLEIDGRPAASQGVGPIPPGGRVPVSFQWTFQKPGWHLAAVCLEDDHLAADNRAWCAVEVAEALPVLLVDGDRRREPWASDTDFLGPALAPPGMPAPLVDAPVVEPAGLTSQRLRDRRVLVLANVPRLTPAQVGALEAFVARGGGLLVLLGDKVDPAFYNETLYRTGAGLLPCALVAPEGAPHPRPDAYRLLTQGLFHPALERFRGPDDDQLSQTAVFRSWRVNLPGASPDRPAAVTIAGLTADRPWLVERPFGKGRVILSTFPLDADWSDLPAKAAFVPLAHELVYYLAGTSAAPHNLLPAEPIVARLDDVTLTTPPLVKRPDARTEPTVLERFPDYQLATYARTLWPGVYWLSRLPPPAPDEPYVVRFDRQESDLTPLSEEDTRRLAEWAGLRFVADGRQLQAEMFAADQRQEIWQLVLVLVLALLVLELGLTRRLARGVSP